MELRCHVQWGRCYSPDQRAQFEAWMRKGGKGRRPKFLDDPPKGDPDWIFMPGCEGGAYNGPEGCVCDTLEMQRNKLAGKVESLRVELERAQERVFQLRLEADVFRSVIRRRGKLRLALRYLRWRKHRHALGAYR